MVGRYNPPMSINTPLVIAFIDNSELEEEISSAVDALGFQLEIINSAEKFGTGSQRDKLGEPIDSGQTSALTRHLTTTQPGLLIFDPSNDAIPWRQWLPIIKTSPATRRLPALALTTGAQADKGELEARGADVTVSTAQFYAQAKKLIQKHTKQYDLAAIATACNQPISELGRKGIELFNQGEFYDAHEELEHAWMEDKGPARDFYRAILQVAVAYYQIQRQNYRGAVKMFLRVRQWLNQLPNQCRGVDLAQLRQDAEAVHDALVALGADHIDEFDLSSFQPVKWVG